MKKVIDERLQDLAKRIMKVGEQMAMADKDKVIAEEACGLAMSFNSFVAKERQAGHRKRMGGLTLTQVNELEAQAAIVLTRIRDAGRREGLEEAARIADGFPTYPVSIGNEIRRSLSREKEVSR